MKLRTAAWSGLGTLAALALTAGWTGYSSELNRARVRVSAGSAVVDTRFGPMEYADAGSGHAILVVHGTGGGFDQGMDLGRYFAGADWRVIAPSRFGYLRSSFPDDPSSANQADAFVDLLDHLGIDRVAVIGVSAGALSAIEFAVRHPTRCAALVAVVPAAYAPGRPPVRAPSAVAAGIIEHALQSDLVFWAGLTFAQDSMIGTLLATDPALLKSAPESEAKRARAILRNILPVSARARGLLNDGKLAGDPAPSRLDAISAPTLAISLEDDRFQTLAAARHLADSVPRARLVTFPTGGHIWLGHHDEVMTAIEEVLLSVFPKGTLDRDAGSRKGAHPR